LQIFPGFIFPDIFGNPGLLKTLGLRKPRTYLIDKGADKVNEADLKLRELISLVSVHHGLTWETKS
jgi:hypothetical protein